MHPPISVVSFKYFESHDVIAVKKKSLLKNWKLTLFLCSHVKKRLNGSRASGCINWADKNYNIITLATITVILL